MDIVSEEPRLDYLVLRCGDLERSRAFYSALGLALVCERHGRGVQHYSCNLGTMVLELYPSRGRNGAVVRLGLRVPSVARAIEGARQVGAEIADAFFAWCHQEADRVLDESPMAQAIGYARNQQVALRRFLDDGRLPLHNNISELNLRREVVGRKNWLFVGSDDGAAVNAAFVSLLASCSLHEIEPLGYIRDLLCLLPRWPHQRVLELAPMNWRETLKQREAQQALDANVFRRVVLGLPGGVDRPQELQQPAAAVSDR
jgi:catechol 2,3-dioxygenase-like lactoylglutathione lyase family enzyme